MPFSLLWSKLLPFIKFADATTKTSAKDNSSFQNERRHKVIYMTKSEFLEPIKDEYILSLSKLTPEELYNDGYNPGPTNPDGSVNFECHCVSHFVASPCGYAFRKAIACQKAATEEQLENGACADELMEFMECVIKTGCFRSREAAEDIGSGNGSEEATGS